MFSSITYWPPWTKQWFTPNWPNLPPLDLLFTSSLLLATIIYSVTVTSQALSILNKPPPMVQAKMSVVLLLSLPQPRRRPLVWQWEVNLHPHQALCYLQTHGNMLRDAYCVVNKSISAAGPRGSNRALYFGFVTCQNIWVNFALYSTVSKVMFVMRQWVPWDVIFTVKFTSKNKTTLIFDSPLRRILLLFFCMLKNATAALNSGIFSHFSFPVRVVP